MAHTCTVAIFTSPREGGKNKNLYHYFSVRARTHIYFTYMCVCVNFVFIRSVSSCFLFVNRSHIPFLLP